MSDMTMKSIPTSKKNNQMLYNEKEHMPLSYKVSQQKLNDNRIKTSDLFRTLS